MTRLEAVFAELQQKVAPASEELLEEAVELSRPKMPKLPEVQDEDDRNIGRFGRRADRDGYHLSASFIGGENDRFVRVKLSVARTDGVQMTHNVHFFLHRTFAQEKVIIPPTNGVSSLELLIYGGFTVGVWIEDTETLLELDLSKARGAPYVVRTQ
ncbi:hypothetical protein QO002_001637 [Pararhizobium capsulatum DSM 1112]|uniref:Prokaryotic YEATS domain-containing protein n=1 Tax=Pararhizobium capsulatum DSM 1112 TaxID=1121113 RepID=A0ABU0BMM2_9HYPH|nr:pYEATS domain-containing protein [Pararhizobium capsulatum]MDQ0319499.1 hypothetical protein [Pararhizobium capsulatum DSM 1112]